MIESIELTKRFGGKTAVNRLTLTLKAGHIYALLGPNGSGKTTWMKMAAGLTLPTEGRILFEGEPVGVNSRAKLAYMPTYSFFYPWMTIQEVGQYYADFFEDFSSEKFSELLKKMELNGEMKVSVLSSGMEAKLRIAATLARDAKAYLLDEPFNGIDLLARDQIRECILGAAAENKLLVISSHLVEEMEAIADSAAFIKNGRLMECRDLDEMRETDGVSMADRYREIYAHTEEDAKCC